MAQTPNPVVEMVGITKRFPGIVANDDIHLRVEKGTIHALLGENGAGKSTLMNILFGLYQPDEGEIRINGKPVSITNPNVAGELGIGMVHQHFMLVHNFTVTENIMLGAETTKAGVHLDQRKAAEQVRELSARYGLAVDPEALVEDISVGQQQRVEILKTLYRGADILIFDEPTAVLTPQEIAELLSIMKSLVAAGKTIILITHKLKEIMQVCDAVTIIRRGKVVDSLPVAGSHPDELAAKMVGREVNFAVEKQATSFSETLLEVRGVTSVDARGVKTLDGLSFELRAGEIFGIAGVDGNGQKELVEVLTGLAAPAAGEVLLKGRSIAGATPRAIAEAGVGYIPEDRHKRGLVLDFDIGENMALKDYYAPKYSKSGLLQFGRIYEKARELIRQFDVRTPDERTKARALSGGNQQKVIIAREVDANPDVLIAAQPTRGLDVGAIEFIHRRLVEQRDQGKAVLLISLELDEILALSDRIGVIYEGRLVGIVDPSKTDEKQLGLMMAGANAKGAETV
ncbi:ABC transporter ATP-binding protein [Paenibacillus sp.]|uniref:ABC transporter ATP-binding protein n=1 Tax=Paenibacillus sp. TaxID=58172 RepID=UPI002D35D47F|nr:ABC transporter ATP-binding protein [Paenibacillus sp.]HZG56610.1 ABC transporter ATP-binding protein [Paenibacillus sp.]